MKASVIITSYNHADAVGRAIESVLSQKTIHNFEIIVLDDGSTDNSVEIIRKYKAFNDKIKMFWCRDNRGIMRTYKIAFALCRGEYLFWCECDDFWTTNDKLQKQIDYMDANPDCGISTHRTKIQKNGKIIDSSLPSESVNGVISFDRLLRGNAYLFAQSYCIRRSTFDKHIDFSFFVRYFFVWDYPIVLELINHTRFHQLDFYGAMFIIEGESITNTKKRIKRLKLILGYAKIRAYFIFKYGCRLSTIGYLAYRFARDIMSIIMRKWYK